VICFAETIATEGLNSINKVSQASATTKRVQIATLIDEMIQKNKNQ